MSAKSLGWREPLVDEAGSTCALRPQERAGRSTKDTRAACLAYGRGRTSPTRSHLSKSNDSLPPSRSEILNRSPVP